MTSKRTRLIVIALLIMGAFALKAPLVAKRARLAPDAIAYANVARNLSSGQGFTSTLKLYYVGDSAVRHCALIDSPPLYPMFAALILHFGRGMISLQLANTLLTCIAAGLVLLIATNLFDRRVGLIAGIAAAIAPNLFHAGSIAISDALTLTLALGALLLILRRDPSPRAWFAAGLLSGLAAVTRYPGAVVVVALIAAALGRPNGRRNGLLCCLGSLLVIAPTVTHTPSAQAMHYAVASFRRSMWYPGSPTDPLYCLHHVGFVSRAILHNTLFYAVDLFSGLRGLFLLSLGLPMWFLRAKATALTREQKLALIIGAMNSAIYAATWSIPPVKGSRFMLLTYCLLLPFCAAGIVSAWDRWGRRGKIVVVAICTVTAAAYVWGCGTAVVNTRGECDPLPAATAALITRSLPQGDAIASNNPWGVAYSTNAPTALLPRNLDREGLSHFIAHYGIGEIVLLGLNPSSKTANTIRSAFKIKKLSPGISTTIVN